MTGQPSEPLRIEPVSPSNVGDLDQLLSRGDPRTCQCAFMRLANSEYQQHDPATRRDVHHEAIDRATAEGRAAGLIAYRGNQPVGWVSMDPRDRFNRLTESNVLRPVDDTPVWSVVCFVVAATARRQGVAGKLLEAAVAYAADHGATMLESYPVEREPDARPSSNALWSGTVSMFERAGFTTVEVRRHNKATPARPIMRRAVAPTATKPATKSATRSARSAP